MKLKSIAPFAALAAFVALSAPVVAQDLAQTAQASPKELIQGAREALDEMGSSKDTVSEMREDAERKGDGEAADCLRARENAIDALVGVSNRAQADMNEALASDQVPRADHEYRKIKVALTKVRQFRSEAATCVGDGQVDGITEVEVSGDEDGSDPTDGTGDDDVVGVDPPGTTPFE